MFIEAITTCVNYSDFLSHTLLFNKRCFDRLIVVTKPEDIKTQRVCAFHHVECITTDAFGSNFNKARAINFGLQQLSRKGWVCHFDADIALPINSRMLMEHANLCKNAIYGIDRYMVQSQKDWFNCISRATPQYDQEIFVYTDHFKMGTRIVKHTLNGYIPIGFFQLWKAAEYPDRWYPEEHENAARTDMLFALQWERKYRLLLPEIIGYHLATPENTSMGANWNGRTTNEFIIE